jgi:hypothetical protein
MKKLLKFYKDFINFILVIIISIAIIFTLVGFNLFEVIYAFLFVLPRLITINKFQEVIPLGELWGT